MLEIILPKSTVCLLTLFMEYFLMLIFYVAKKYISLLTPGVLVYVKKLSSSLRTYL